MRGGTQQLDPTSGDRGVQVLLPGHAQRCSRRNRDGGSSWHKTGARREQPSMSASRAKRPLAVKGSKTVLALRMAPPAISMVMHSGGTPRHLAAPHGITPPSRNALRREIKTRCASSSPSSVPLAGRMLRPSLGGSPCRHAPWRLPRRSGLRWLYSACLSPPARSRLRR
jgi:hypothetical protein